MNGPLIVISFAMSLVVIGSFYAIKSIILWKKINIAGIGVEVTKSRSFLHTNFMLSSIIGAFVAIHVFLEFIQHTVSIESPSLNGLSFALYYFTILAIVISLFLLAFKWYKLLSKVNRWDKRWISGKE